MDSLTQTTWLFFSKKSAIFLATEIITVTVFKSSYFLLLSFLSQVYILPLLPVMTGTFLGLDLISKITGRCTHGTKKWVPSPTTVFLIPVNLSKITALCPPSTEKKKQIHNLINISVWIKKMVSCYKVLSLWSQSIDWLAAVVFPIVPFLGPNYSVLCSYYNSCLLLHHLRILA